MTTQNNSDLLKENEALKIENKRLNKLLLGLIAALLIVFLIVLAISAYDDHKYRQKIDKSLEEWKQLRLATEVDYQRQLEQLYENYKETEKRINEINNLTRELGKYNITFRP